MISEEMIKNAATEADQAIRDSLPAPAECEHEFSPLFQRKMCQAFRMVKHPVIYKLPRYAACFVLAAALASGTWLTANAEARTAFFAWMREQYEAFVEYRFTGEASQENESADYELTWLPEGFSLQKEQNLDGGTYLTYTDDSGQRIIFSCLKGDDCSQACLLHPTIRRFSRLKSEISAQISIKPTEKHPPICLSGHQQKIISFFILWQTFPSLL